MNDEAENMKNGGQLIADALAAHGVDTVFCVPGESYLEVLDGLYDHTNDIRVVSCRHEHGAANMAEAYGKLTGKPGICMVTRGPGACNASIGVHTAFQDSTPMVLLIGQVARPHLGREAFQEVDFGQMFGPLVKRVEQIETAAGASDAIGRAMHDAVSGRPGPVVLSLPEDMLRETAPEAEFTPLAADFESPSAGDMERFHHMVGDCERPLMLVGGGGWTDKARADIVTYAEANAIPVCCSFRRQDIFDNTHDNFAGEMGIAPNPLLIKRMAAADLIIVVGARLGEMTTQGYTLLDEPKPTQEFIHIHTDAGELGRVYTPDLGIASAMEVFAEDASKLVPTVSAHRKEWLTSARQDYIQGRVPSPYEGALDLGHVMAELDDLLGNNAIVTVDAGNCSGWPQRFLTYGGGRRLLGPTSGAMGYGVPAAIAAKLHNPDHIVVGCVGDGCFGMTGQELTTAVAEGATPIILIFNNGMYGTIRLHQERRHPGRVIATDLLNPDYAAVARASGAFGETIEKTEDFRPAFERALRSGLPAVLDLRMDPNVISTRTTLSEVGESH
ncbi:MAG: thiamine pyrophosphate-binding protein [Rhodospirillaceae bacterium]|jgi:acetolactate synthase I/II/III large subunit|nr:thiamine pyrophosphate-binding protein [Rhodospirillaceae bacterium]MBT4218541.1 thiamine pyrophosphate-binding protein [Rhodospirillaceae bacterium]MBT5014175.1 thiamine pyrophosphate-binding protein [Rhodospirillaceae bacterium]MBT7356172.1 thiamine pyrophosphate-binding protein [Rhodospirillaceae bacterium]